MSELNLEDMPIVDNPEKNINEGLNEIQKTELQKIDPSLNEQTISIIIDALHDHQEQLLENEGARQTILEEIVNFVKERAQDYEKIEDMQNDLTQIIKTSLEKAA
jgi:hypothetical protein